MWSGSRSLAAGWSGGACSHWSPRPPPLLHDALIGRGTWAAAKVTELLGGEGYEATGHPSHAPVLTRMAQQLGAAIPTYTVITALTLVLLRRVVGEQFQTFLG